MGSKNDEDKHIVSRGGKTRTRIGVEGTGNNGLEFAHSNAQLGGRGAQIGDGGLSRHSQLRESVPRGQGEQQILDDRVVFSFVQEVVEDSHCALTHVLVVTPGQRLQVRGISHESSDSVSTETWHQSIADCDFS